MSDEVKTCEFKAEIKQLLDIITNSLYTNREIFLRELVSNASDALEKLRFEVSRGATVKDGESDLEIAINVDKDKGILTITDTGIGMNADEVMENIGTIARSGSGEFLRNLAENKGADPGAIIGRFGVGFYAVFMVADKVILTSRSFRDGDKTVEWVSDGLGTYEIKEIDEDRPRGTTIQVHLKEDAKEFAEVFTAKRIITRHSNFIPFPIKVDGEKVNTVAALWREPKFSIKQEQYDEFYTFLTYDSDKPMDTLHLSVDAPVQFSALMFIPSKPSDLFGFDRDKYGLDLYVRRVLIQKEFSALLPEYLGFLKGVADTEDLPLNISRETLQENLLVTKMATTITKQVLERLQKLAGEEPEQYENFWRQHGKVFRMGYNDYPNRERFGPLLRFNSSIHTDKDGLTGLDGYIERAKEGQKEIYYLSGASRESIALSPHLEIFRRKGLEVLYLFEPIDEFVMDSLREYKEFKFKAVENVDPASLESFENAVTDEEAKAEELSTEDSDTLKGLTDRIKEILGEDRVKEVRISKRLTTSPSCLVNPDGEVTSQMQKILKVMGKDTSIPVKIMEINPDHRLIRNMIRIFRADVADAYLVSAVEQLYESALLLEGYLTDPHRMVGRIADLLDKSSGWYAEIKRL
ncbi:MAG: molecular chaperone HtpG [Deltaproteobacteria bacterium]|nr:molecular chaperone HtpG [Deltaproteobacteria bacterium]